MNSPPKFGDRKKIKKQIFSAPLYFGGETVSF
jgi:hypothetical protein